MTGATESIQIDRILNSKTLRSAEGLRRLLKFLADKSLRGEDADLKEYSIGIDAFGKPTTYDPKDDSIVRTQAGRLRQKLAEYYQIEGKNDPIIVTLPKGKFSLEWQTRGKVSGSGRRPWLLTACLILVTCLIAMTVWAVYATVALWVVQKPAEPRSQRTPEIAAFWSPLFDVEHPLLISISAVLFVQLPDGGYFRDPNLNRPEDESRSPSLAAVQQVLHAPRPLPTFSFGALGAAHASFLLGRLLESQNVPASLVNSDELSWRQVTENNLILLGSSRYFKQLTSLPVKTELYLEPDLGIQNINPGPHEPAIFRDEGSKQTGVAYVLVSHTPGPLGTTNILSISGRQSAGIHGAVKSLIDPASARELVAKLRRPSGEFPRFYQMVLRVRYHDVVPLETSYVLHHELHFQNLK